MITTCESSELQLCKGQDFAIHGKIENNKTIYWQALFDGHGNDSCIQAIRQTMKNHVNEIILSEEPLQKIQEYIDAIEIPEDTKKASGSTGIIVKKWIEENKVHVEISYVGDSTLMIYCNDVCVYKNELHDVNHFKQMTKLASVGAINMDEPTISQGPRFDLMDANTVLCSTGLYVKIVDPSHPKGYRPISTSSTLGHNNLYCGLHAENNKFLFNLTDKLRIICMSDGITDVVLPNNPVLQYGTCVEILEEARVKWSQTWNAYVKKDDLIDFSSKITTQIPTNSWDDCSVCIMAQIPQEIDENNDQKRLFSNTS
jgi:hypothetical protein